MDSNLREGRRGSYTSNSDLADIPTLVASNGEVNEVQIYFPEMYSKVPRTEKCRSNLVITNTDLTTFFLGPGIFSLDTTLYKSRYSTESNTTKISILRKDF
jgi:hypothetical protein